MRAVTFMLLMICLLLTSSGCRSNMAEPERTRRDREPAPDSFGFRPGRAASGRPVLDAHLPGYWFPRIYQDGSGWLNYQSQPYLYGNVPAGTFSARELEPLYKAMQAQEPPTGLWSARLEFILERPDGTRFERTGWLTDPAVAARLIRHFQAHVDNPDALNKDLRRDPPVPIELLMHPD